ncbi:MAG: L-threonylcarbamoyladenylate synthase [Pirellulales bacterium]
MDPNLPAAESIERAAALVRAGRLVAFPTETVYGLGANALDAEAVARIFHVKGRPPNNPLIVHVADEQRARAVVAEWPEAARRLAGRFWPGPLSLVVAKGERVPAVVTAGGATVAVRVPAHPVARALIEAAGVPIAAPSANPSNRVSATRAEHVLAGLEGRVDLILDAGPTSGGLESTVLDLTRRPPRLLRPGLISRRQIEEALGSPLEMSAPSKAQANVPLPSPGMLPRHYAPAAPLDCVSQGWPAVRALTEQSIGVGWLAMPGDPAEHLPGLVRIEMPGEAAPYSAQLYAALHSLDAAGVERIVVTLPPDGEDWAAVHNRLARMRS